LQAQWRVEMVNNCANPKCAKPLHYLREGRVFVFDVQDQPLKRNGEKGHHLEHYWLCGECSGQFLVEHEADQGVRLVPRRAASRYVVQETPGESSARVVLAS
jgi:hypothetical protein